MHGKRLAVGLAAPRCEKGSVHLRVSIQQHLSFFHPKIRVLYLKFNKSTAANGIMHFIVLHTYIYTRISTLKMYSPQKSSPFSFCILCCHRSPCCFCIQYLLALFQQFMCALAIVYCFLLFGLILHVKVNVGRIFARKACLDTFRTHFKVQSIFLSPSRLPFLRCIQCYVLLL